MAKKYEANDIEVLDGLEGVKQNVGMYLGSRETQVLHAFREIFENSIDVYAKGLNNFISVNLQNNKDSQTFVVIDHGPGIPVELNKKTKLSTLTTVFTTLHAGSNFDKAAKGKAAARGKHGVGSSATCACSSVFIVYTCRNKQWYTQTFKKGKPTTKVEKCKLPTSYKKLGAKADCGTIIEFIPDYTILPKTILKEQDLFDYVKQSSELNTGLKVRFIGPKLDETFLNKRGIISLLEDFISHQKKINLLGKPFIFENDILNVALQWSNLEGENVLSYVNFSETAGGGCFLIEDRVLLTDGSKKSFKELVEIYEKTGEVKMGYTYDIKEDKIKEVPLLCPSKTKEVTELVKVTLSDGSEFTCTTDHPWLHQDNMWVEAKDLEVGDELVTFKTQS